LQGPCPVEVPRRALCSQHGAHRRHPAARARRQPHRVRPAAHSHSPEAVMATWPGYVPGQSPVAALGHARAQPPASPHATRTFDVTTGSWRSRGRCSATTPKADTSTSSASSRTTRRADRLLHLARPALAQPVSQCSEGMGWRIGPSQGTCREQPRSNRHRRAACSARCRRSRSAVTGARRRVSWRVRCCASWRRDRRRQ
jgi:hypothetical protein